LSTLHALTELNLRRNKIEKVLELDRLPALQRVFLSHNLISNVRDMGCLFNVKLLIELSLDGNPISDPDVNVSNANNGGSSSSSRDNSTTVNSYRVRVIAGMPSLRHLDLKRITDEERASAVATFSQMALDEAAALDGQLGLDSSTPTDETAASTTGTLTSIAPRSGRPRSPGGLMGGIMSARSLMALENPNSNGGIAHSASPDLASPFHGGGAGLAALARAGKLSPSQPMFDLEIIGPNEKALVAVGDTWEWIQANKRLLATVVEASLLHVKKEIVVARFVSNIASLPALKNFRLMHNDIDSIHDLLTIFDSLGPSCRGNMETFTIMHNPVCVNFYSLMKAYALLSFPRLKIFNDDAVCMSDFSRATAVLTPLLKALSIGAPSPAAGYLIQALQQQVQQQQSSSTLSSLCAPTPGKPLSSRRRENTVTLVSNPSSMAYRRLSVSMQASLAAAAAAAVPSSSSPSPDGANNNNNNSAGVATGNSVPLSSALISSLAAGNNSANSNVATVADMCGTVISRREIMRLFDAVCGLSWD
jgi:hypothetical protein